MYQSKVGDKLIFSTYWHRLRYRVISCFSGGERITSPRFLVRNTVYAKWKEPRQFLCIHELAVSSSGMSFCLPWNSRVRRIVKRSPTERLQKCERPDVLLSVYRRGGSSMRLTFRPLYFWQVLRALSSSSQSLSMS